MNGSSKQTSQRTYLSFFVFHNHARLNQWIEFLSPQSPSEFTNLRQLLKKITLYLHAFPKQENNRTVVYRNGCFTNSSHLGNQKHKKILRKHMYIPHDMFPHSSSSLNFYSSHYHFILFILFNFKDGDNSKIPFFARQATEKCTEMEKSLLLLEGYNFQRNLSTRVKNSLP